MWEPEAVRRGRGTATAGAAGVLACLNMRLRLEQLLEAAGRTAAVAIQFLNVQMCEGTCDVGKQSRRSVWPRAACQCIQLYSHGCV